MNSNIKKSKCHVLGVNYCEDTVDPYEELHLFTPQEIASMDFMMDMDEEECSQGIEAEDLSSLLEQFEATQSTDGGVIEDESTDLSKTDNQIEECENVKTKQESQTSAGNPTVVPSKVLEKIRAVQASKRKSAIMLPMSVPAKHHRGLPSEISAAAGSKKLQRIIKENSVTKSDKEMEQAVQDAIGDHDYCFVNTPPPSTASTPVVQQTSKPTETNGTSEYMSSVEVSVHTNSICESVSSTSSVVDTVDVNNATSASQESKDSGMEEGEIIESDNNTSVEEINEIPAKDSVFFPCPQNLKTKRSYRKREEPVLPDSSKFYDKIPAYFTTLSLPKKPPKKTNVGESGISIEDFIPRDRSPTRESDTLYSKLPDYYSCFTNSTKYDGTTEEEVLEIKQEPVDDFEHDCQSERNSRSRRKSRSRSFSSWSSSSCSYSSYRSSSRSHSRSSSRRRSHDRYRRSRRRGRRHSYSSSSRSRYSSSRSRSRSFSRSRSRSGSKPRRYRSFRSRSKSHSHSYRSRSRHRTRRSYTRSRSRSCSLEKRRMAKKKLKEEEKQRQIAERRIVYVGRIPSDFTKRDLRRRFERFGDIVNVSTHFREAGDNYGFVTFAYTCDAFAAIEKGNAVPGELQFDLCFGGRRQFCDTDYADLDGKVEDEDMFRSNKPKPTSDFDELLRQAQKKIKKTS